MDLARQCLWCSTSSSSKVLVWAEEGLGVAVGVGVVPGDRQGVRVGVRRWAWRGAAITWEEVGGGATGVGQVWVAWEEEVQSHTQLHPLHPHCRAL